MGALEVVGALCTVHAMFGGNLKALKNKVCFFKKKKRKQRTEPARVSL